MIISIDIGGTFTRVYSNEKDQTIKFETNPTNFQTTFNQMISAIQKLSEQEKITKIGIASVGPLDIQKGVILNPPNLFNDWHNCNIVEKFKNLYNCEIKLDNDANVAALGQYLTLENKPSHLVYITFSTGVGAGLIIDGKIYHGAKGQAFELANALPDYEFNQEGYHSGIEYFIGGNGLINQSHLKGLQNINSTKELFDLYYQENKIATEILNVGKNKVKSFLATIIYLINPSVIVIGGSVALNNQEWFQSIIDEVVLTTKKDINYLTNFKFASNIDYATLLACSKL